MHQSECQRRIGSRVDHQMLIRQRSGPCLVRIDHYQPRTLPPSLFDKRPQVNIVSVDIRAPCNHKPCVGKVFGPRAKLDAIDAEQRCPACRRADRAVQLRSSQSIEEATVHRSVAKLPDRSRIAVGQNALRAKLIGYLRQACRNLIQSVVPADSLKGVGLMPLR